MLWDNIFNFFVQLIFGGTNTDLDGFGGFIGSDYNDNSFYTNTLYVQLPLNNGYDNSPIFVTFGNYLSLIATIITMVVILLFCVFIIKKIIGIVFRLFTGSSSF